MLASTLRYTHLMPFNDCDLLPAIHGESIDVMEFDNSAGGIMLRVDNQAIELFRHKCVRLPVFLFANSNWCTSVSSKINYRVPDDIRRTLLRLDIDPMLLFVGSESMQTYISRGFIYIRPTIESVTHGLVSGDPDTLARLITYYEKKYGVPPLEYRDLIPFLMDLYFRESPDFKLAGVNKNCIATSTLSYRPQLITTEELHDDDIMNNVKMDEPFTITIYKLSSEDESVSAGNLSECEPSHLKT